MLLNGLCATQQRIKIIHSLKEHTLDKIIFIVLMASTSKTKLKKKRRKNTVAEQPNSTSDTNAWKEIQKQNRDNQSWQLIIWTYRNTDGTAVSTRFWRAPYLYYDVMMNINNTQVFFLCFGLVLLAASFILLPVAGNWYNQYDSIWLIINLYCLFFLQFNIPNKSYICTVSHANDDSHFEFKTHFTLFKFAHKETYYKYEFRNDYIKLNRKTCWK